MRIRFVAPDLRALDGLKSEALALALFEDDRPPRGAVGLSDWRLAGQLSRLLLRGAIRGTPREQVLVPGRPRLPFDKVFLFGAGPLEALAAPSPAFEDLLERMLSALDRARVRASVLELPGRGAGAVDPAAAMEGFLRVARRHAEQDQVTLIEPPEAQRAMAPVLDLDRRRERALSE